MKNLQSCKAVLWVGLLCLTAAIAAQGQTLTTLVNFDGPNGGNPGAPLILGTDGNFYGTAGGGAAQDGIVFKMTPSGTLSTVYSFCSLSSCADGSGLNAAVVQGTDGDFYGVTVGGGSAQAGTVFKLTSTGTLTTLHSFCSLSNCSDGKEPFGGIIQASDGNFYGTTVFGGTNGLGTVFKITPEGGLTTLYSFCSLSNCSDGKEPQSALVQGSDGNLYGTVFFGGSLGTGCAPLGCGTLFKVATDGVLSTLYTFCSLANCADGVNPQGLTAGLDGSFYGTTSAGGGTHGYGTVFQFASSGTLSTIYNFCSLTNCADGSGSTGWLIFGADGNLYGTAKGGKTKGGMLFELTQSGTLSTLYGFCSLTNCTDGTSPAGILRTSSGIIYGAAAGGGTAGSGTIFSWSSYVTLAPTFTPTSVSFGNQALDITSKAIPLVIKNVNTGIATLDVSGFTVASPFAISSNRCPSTLAAGKSCDLLLTFTPTVLGAASGTLSVADNAPGSPQKVSLSGAGVAQAVVTPSSFSFPATKVGTTSSAKAATLKNNLPTTLTGITSSTTGPFAVAATTCTSTLASYKVCTFSVTFTPTAKGVATGTLSVTDSANSSPQTVALSGTGD